MAKIEIAPINRVAVTSFVLCIGAGAVISASVHHPAPLKAAWWACTSCSQLR
jgi:hypothetical protein